MLTNVDSLNFCQQVYGQNSESPFPAHTVLLRAGPNLDNVT